MKCKLLKKYATPILPIENLVLIGQAEKKMFENNGYAHVYSPGAGADNPLGSNIFH